MKELKELTLLVSDEEHKRQMRRALFSLPSVSADFIS
jgi:hypothetical protein